MQFLAQSFLRGNGAPVSTWRISDDCSRSEGRMGRKKWKVGNIQDTGLRHRSVSRAFGDSCTEMGCAVWGRRGRPSSSAAASFPSVDEMCFFAVRLHRPKFSVGVVSPVSGHQGRAESAVFTAREGLLARVRAPFPGRLSPASEDSPKAPSRKPVQHGVFLGSACGCQVTALPMRLFVCSLVVRAFLPSSTPGRKSRPTSLDEELPRLSGLRPPLQGFGGH